MKLKKKIMTAGAVSALSFSMALFAQESQSQTGQSSSRDLESSSQSRMQSQQRDQQEFGARSQSSSQSREKASELKGTKVKSQSGEDLGKVEDVAINLENGELAYLLVGEGSDFKPVPSQAARIDRSEGDLALTVDIDEDRWEEAPTVEKDEIAQLGQEQRGQEIYRFFGEDYDSRQQQMQYGSPSRERGMQDSSSQSQRSRSGEQSSQQESQRSSSQSDQSAQSPGSSSQSSQSSSRDSDQQEFGARSGQSSSSADRSQSSSAQSPGSSTQSSQSAQSQSSQSAQSPSSSSSSSASQQEFGARSQSSSAMQSSGKTRLGSELMKSDIQNQQQEKIGEVEDLLLNLEEGRVDLVLFKAEDESGTFAVSPSALQASGEDELSLNVSEQDLQQAQTLREQEIESHVRQAQAGSQQSPQVYRWEGESESSSIFGSPDRDRESSKSKSESRSRSSDPSSSSSSGSSLDRSSSSSDRSSSGSERSSSGSSSSGTSSGSSSDR